MGWNSWDSYGLTIGEADYRANAKVLSSLKKYGWQYAVVDMGWYMADPNGKERAARDFQIDGNAVQRAFFWENGVLHDIGADLSNSDSSVYSYSMASGINEQGQIVALGSPRELTESLDISHLPPPEPRKTTATLEDVFVSLTGRTLRDE